jgi:hypothetical protein
MVPRTCHNPTSRVERPVALWLSRDLDFDLPALPASLGGRCNLLAWASDRSPASDTTEPVDVGLQEIPHVGHFDDTFSGP